MNEKDEFADDEIRKIRILKIVHLFRTKYIEILASNRNCIKSTCFHLGYISITTLSNRKYRFILKN